MAEQSRGHGDGPTWLVPFPYTTDATPVGRGSSPLAQEHAAPPLVTSSLCAPWLGSGRSSSHGGVLEQKVIGRPSLPMQVVTGEDHPKTTVYIETPKANSSNIATWYLRTAFRSCSVISLSAFSHFGSTIRSGRPSVTTRIIPATSADMNKMDSVENPRKCPTGKPANWVETILPAIARKARWSTAFQRSASKTAHEARANAAARTITNAPIQYAPLAAPTCFDTASPAAVIDGYPPRCSNTRRTARARNSSVIFFGMAHILPTQKDAASNPGRFTYPSPGSTANRVATRSPRFDEKSGFRRGPGGSL